MENDIFKVNARRCQLCGRLLFSEEALKTGYGCTCMKKAKKEQEEKQPIPGQMTIDEWFSDKKEPEKVYEVDIRGLCDDAWCPKCNYPFDEQTEKDCETCPVCGIKVDWTPWHRANDEDEQ